jgi:hypothetical protein
MSLQLEYQDDAILLEISRRLVRSGDSEIPEGPRDRMADGWSATVTESRWIVDVRSSGRWSGTDLLG